MSDTDDETQRDQILVQLRDALRRIATFDGGKVGRLAPFNYAAIWAQDALEATGDDWRKHQMGIADRISEDARQNKEDRKLLTRIDSFGKGLTAGEAELLESFMRWTEQGKPLTPLQRKVAMDIDNKRVGE